jgi:branched-subunit amino acid aminotransferase/4-amino-4-deoxychorismate lyase
MAELNGSPVSAEALVALGLVNYGHFTSMRVDNEHIRGLSQHLDRLIRDCAVLFDAGLDRERIREFIRHAVTGRPGSFIVRVTVFDPELALSHPGATAEPSVLITRRSAIAWPPSAMRVEAVSYSRELPEVKHVGLFGALWTRRNAQRHGYDDALFIDGASFVSEGPTWNVGFFDGDRVIWPNAAVLPGITMKLLKQVHEHSISAPVSIRDVAGMQAAFATNTSVGVRAISAVDNVQLTDDHPILDTLRKEYDEIPAERI